MVIILGYEPSTEVTVKHLSIGCLPFLSTLGNQLWEIYAPMRIAFLFGYKLVIVETDNYEALKAIQKFRTSAPATVYDILDQIDTLKNNKNWICSIAFVFPARNKVARYTTKLGMEVGDMIYTMDRTITGVEELFDWDMGLGVDHPDFMDVPLVLEAPDPVNFDVGLTLSDNVNNLGLGQSDAPIENPQLTSKMVRMILTEYLRQSSLLLIESLKTSSEQTKL